MVSGYKADSGEYGDALALQPVPAVDMDPVTKTAKVHKEARNEI